MRPQRRQTMWPWGGSASVLGAGGRGEALRRVDGAGRGRDFVVRFFRRRSVTGAPTPLPVFERSEIARAGAEGEP